MASGDFKTSRTVEQIISGHVSMLPRDVVDQSNLAMRSPVGPDCEITDKKDDVKECSRARKEAAITVKF
jgi:hypothetical protein